MSKDDGFAELLQYGFTTRQEQMSKKQKAWAEHLEKEVENLKLCCEKSDDLVKNINKEFCDIKNLMSSEIENENNSKELSQKTQSLQSEINSLQTRNEILATDLTAKKAELEKEQASTAEQKTKVEEKRAIINTTSDSFRKFLGLDIRILKANRMQFVFKKLDSEEIESFIIISLNDRVYGVTESFPELDNLEQLENALNKTNNLAGFIQHSRNLLKERLENLS